MHTLALICGVVALTLTGCGGSTESTSSEPLRPGVYQFELGRQYLLDNGISEDQAEHESGVHQETLGEDGSFVDSWETAEGLTGSCSGTYEEGDSNRVTFRWTSGCYGDWEMTYSIDGDTVNWSDPESLPPNDSEEDQKVNEVFNSVPWVYTGQGS